MSEGKGICLLKTVLRIAAQHESDASPVGEQSTLLVITYKMKKTIAMQRGGHCAMHSGTPMLKDRGHEVHPH